MCEHRETRAVDIELEQLGRRAGYFLLLSAALQAARELGDEGEQKLLSAAVSNASRRLKLSAPAHGELERAGAEAAREICA